MLVLHTDVAGQRSRVAGIVGHEHRTVAVGTPEEAVAALDRSVALVLCEAQLCTDALVRSAKEVGATCALLVDEIDWQQIHIYAKHGQVAAVVDDVLGIQDVVTSALSPRVASRHPLASGEVELTIGGRVLSGSAVDISESGVSVQVAADPDVPPLARGTRIDRLRIRSAGTPVLDEASAVVRWVAFDGSGPRPLYVVGCEFVSRTTPLVMERVDKQFQAMAVLSSAVRRAPLDLAFPDHPEIDGIRADCEFGDGRLVVRGALPAGLERGDVVAGTFDLSGTVYRFLSSILEVDPAGWWIKLPRTLGYSRQRRVVRFKPADRTVSVAFTSPYTGESVSAPVIDITSLGLSFSLSADSLLPEGTLLSPLLVSFPNGAGFEVSARVRTVSPKGTRGRARKCGLEFLEMDEPMRGALTDAVVNCVLTEIVDGVGTTFEQMWEILLQNGFLYPEKLASIDEEQARRTLSPLLASPTSPMKTVLFRQNGVVMGHVCALRTYLHTWSLQHIVGEKHRGAGKMLNMAVAAYLEQLPEIEWLHSFFRPDNQWPALLAREFERGMAHTGLMRHASYHYFLGHTSPIPPMFPGLIVRPATREDLVAVEGHLQRTLGDVAVQAEDLSAARILLSDVDDQFARFGTMRRREVWVACSGDERLGFSLMEISSPWMNLSDLTSAFRVFELKAHPEAGRAVEALIATARHRYHQYGRNLCVALAEPAQVGVFSSAGMERKKEYTSFTWSRSLSWWLFEYNLFPRSRREPRDG